MEPLATQRVVEILSRFVTSYLDRAAQYFVTPMNANIVNSSDVFRANRHAIWLLTVAGLYEPVTVRSCLAEWPFQIVPGGTK